VRWPRLSERAHLTAAGPPIGTWDLLDNREPRWLGRISMTLQAGAEVTT
jgi:hypothetical protein